MNVSLTPTLEKMVREKVESGLYNNSSEVIREALRLMNTHERLLLEEKRERLRAYLKEGLESIERGDGVELEDGAAIDRFFAGLSRGK
jgi:antitoxin ParD1/3/4